MKKRKLLALAALALLIGPMTAHSASIVYDVNRTIGSGTISGFVQTDGTVGILSSANITDWTLTLTAPNLLGGSPDVIDFGSGLTGQTFLSGSATSATMTQLLFDFGATGFFLLQELTSNLNFWCLETAGVTCTGSGPGEHMGRSNTLSPVAQTASYTGGTIVIGTANVAPVPEPEIYAMMGLGLGLLGWIGRRKKLRDGATA